LRTERAHEPWRQVFDFKTSKCFSTL
jgi:hypothetical protein